jgi:hypothetical protein
MRRHFRVRRFKRRLRTQRLRAKLQLIRSHIQSQHTQPHRHTKLHGQMPQPTGCTNYSKELARAGFRGFYT